MPVGSELALFVYQRQAFYAPIAASLSVALSPNETRITDAGVKARLIYGASGRQGTPLPYLAWYGPLDEDPNLVADGSLIAKTAHWWFTCYAAYLDDADSWMESIQNDVTQRLTGAVFTNLTTVRLMSMLVVPRSRTILRVDQTQLTAKEYAPYGVTAKFQISWQNLS